MRYLLALIPPEHLNRVYDALVSIHVRGVTISEAEGFGQEHDPSNPEYQNFLGVETTKKKRIEIICHDEEAEKIIETIYEASHTGLAGDGKIFMMPVMDALRIKTGERGVAALGPRKNGNGNGKTNY